MDLLLKINILLHGKLCGVHSVWGSLKCWKSYLCDLKRVKSLCFRITRHLLFLFSFLSFLCTICIVILHYILGRCWLKTIRLVFDGKSPREGMPYLCFIVYWGIWIACLMNMFAAYLPESWRKASYYSWRQSRLYVGGFKKWKGILLLIFSTTPLRTSVHEWVCVIFVLILA